MIDDYIKTSNGLLHALFRLTARRFGSLHFPVIFLILFFKFFWFSELNLSPHFSVIPFSLSLLCTYIYIHIYVYVYICVYIYIYIYICICI